ncbi:MAG: acyl-CoA dehydrogenase family protein [bacterium]|nr:acyl-CoA dehydrogenase family protein [Acidimicrobiia bacterium]MCY4649050.1 acyl-CoA dehydrogenase family protein [bacterium]
MHFALTDEQELIVATVAEFTERELMPHEEEVERLGRVPGQLAAGIKKKAIEAGIFSANMPVEVGGAGLDNLTMALVEKELGKTAYALHHLVARPSNILLACVGEQRDRYLYPTVAGRRMEALAMSEPDAGSDLRGMKCRAVRDGDEYVIRGVKHFISHGDICDYVILFAATGEESPQDAGGGRAPRKITAFLVDVGTPGFEVQEGYRCVSHRGYNNAVFSFDDCRIPASQILGEEHQGFEVANTWLGGTRLAVAANCLGRAERAMGLATEWAATRTQFGQTIGRFQGVSFKLADMATQMAAAELLTLRAAWKADRGEMSSADAAMAKLAATEMLAHVTDEAIQIFGGMGLMGELPLERMWRDARVERIWDGTSEIQRHIISRSILRPLGG